jgi:hypothetical protein
MLSFIFVHAVMLAVLAVTVAPCTLTVKEVVFSLLEIGYCLHSASCINVCYIHILLPTNLCNSKGNLFIYLRTYFPLAFSDAFCSSR